MNKILVASHGHMASGIQSSIEILTGMSSDITVIDAYVDEHNFVTDIRKFVSDLNGEFGIIFTDIEGGSVNQKAVLEATGKDNVMIVAGMNLPIVLATMLEIDSLNKDRLKELIKESQVKMVSMKNNKYDLSDNEFLA